MADAVALYRRLGFVEICPYCPNPMPDALYMELTISNTRSETMKRLVLVLALALLARNSLAATSTDVSYKSGDDTVHGMLYTAFRNRVRSPRLSPRMNGGGSMTG